MAKKEKPLRKKKNKQNKERKKKMKQKLIIKITKALVTVGVLVILSGCSGKGKVAKCDSCSKISNGMVLRFEEKLEKVAGYKGKVRPSKKSRKQKTYVIYNINGEYVAVNLENYAEEVKKPNFDIETYYEDNSIKGLERHEDQDSEIYDTYDDKILISRTLFAFVNPDEANDLFVDPVSQKEFNHQNELNAYDTSRQLSFSQDEKIENFKNILHVEFGLPKDKAQRTSELAFQFVSLPKDAYKRETLNDFSRKALGLSYDEMEAAGKNMSPIKIHEAVQKAAVHMGTDVRNAYALLSLFL